MLKFLLLVLTLIYSTTAFAVVGTEYDTQKRKSVSKEKNIQKQRSLTIKDTHTKRDSVSWRRSTTIEVSLDGLIFSEIAKQEAQGIEPWASCLLVLAPALPRDFFYIEDTDTVDVYYLEYLQKAAQINKQVDEDIIDLEALKGYVECLTIYGEAIGYILQNIDSSYKSIDSLQEHIKTLLSKAKHKNKANEVQNCRFAGSLEKLQCRDVYIEIAESPVLMISKKKIYAPPFYNDISAKFQMDQSTAREISRANDKEKTRINSLSMSMRDNLEKGKTSRWAVRLTP